MGVLTYILADGIVVHGCGYGLNKQKKKTCLCSCASFCLFNIVAFARNKNLVLTKAFVSLQLIRSRRIILSGVCACACVRARAMRVCVCVCVCVSM